MNGDLLVVDAETLQQLLTEGTLTQEQYDSLAESLEENQTLRQWLTEGRIDQEIYDALVKAMTADKEI